MTGFKEFAQACRTIEDIPGSLDMTEKVAQLLQDVNCDELPVVTHFIMGEVFPAWSTEDLGIGTSLLYAALSKAAGISLKDIESLIRDTGDIGKTATKALSGKSKGQATFSSFLNDSQELSILEVFERFKNISKVSGKGSQTTKIKNLQYLFNSSSPDEAGYIARLAIEDLRIGVGEGIVRDAIAKAFDVPTSDVERAFMLTNDMGLVAVAARRGGVDEVTKLNLELKRPIKMMLAQVTPTIEDAINEMEIAAIEWKFDGARVQIHKDGDNITLFSRRLEDVTHSLPDIVSAVREHVTADSAILDGEAFAVDEAGRPRAFQEILKRFRRKYDVETTAREIPLTLRLFDLVYLNGENLLDKPLTERRAALVGCVKNSGPIKVDSQILTSDVEEVNRIYNEALEAGHEGIMIKNPQSSYSPGKRGKNWLKKKPLMETLDLVVIGAEWGYGRRTNFMGSFNLACHDPDTGRFLSMGKVGTGINDEQLAELTETFSNLIVIESGMEIELKPEVVFEIAFEEIQKSTNYESGFALRFPRLVNVRDDKSPDEADTLQRIESIYSAQRK
ncbi:MAG: ATP-dependent DNA ligase [Methanosarcinaceae archaeon]|nr:ATP-dependent DNA ligase [Methanosarcinaceae archaeon]